MATTQDSLIRKIERFCRAKRISPSKFGQLAVNDSAFVHDLKAGRSITGRTRDKIEAYMKGSQ